MFKKIRKLFFGETPEEGVTLYVPDGWKPPQPPSRTAETDGDEEVAGGDPREDITPVLASPKAAVPNAPSAPVAAPEDRGEAEDEVVRLDLGAPGEEASTPSASKSAGDIVAGRGKKPDPGVQPGDRTGEGKAGAPKGPLRKKL